MSSVKEDDKREDAESPQALYQHCEKTYKAMLQQAEGKLLWDEDAQQERIFVIWEGMLTQFITGQLNLSVPYYTYITRALKRMGCIRQIKRGGGTSPSQWELIAEPTLELFEEKHLPRQKPQDKYALVQDQMDSFNKRLLVVERALQAVIDEESSSA